MIRPTKDLSKANLWQMIFVNELSQAPLSLCLEKLLIFFLNNKLLVEFLYGWTNLQKMG